MSSTMSSWGVRKPSRTYSRQSKRSLHDEEPPTKRRRVEISQASVESKIEIAVAATLTTLNTPERDCSTSPSSRPKDFPAIFSDEPLNSTPPSSPLPLQTSPLIQTRRPIFSFLKRRPEARPAPKEPLSVRDDNVPGPTKPLQKTKRLVQMQLDLAGDLRKTCKTCGMEYIPSNAEDAALHRKFHAMNVGGVDFSKAVVERMKKNQVWAGGDGSFIAVIGRKDTLALRNKAVEVLRVVNTELAAVPIPEQALWSQIRTPIAGDAPVPGTDGAKTTEKGVRNCPTSDRFKAYLYIRGQKCVGACLAERIQEAYTVVGQDDVSELAGKVPAAGESYSSSISVSADTEAVLLGISRIWTSNLHRKAGIATRLLDSARSEFLYGMTIEKDRVAFSQPTESGGKLARRWFSRRVGWHVYVD